MSFPLPPPRRHSGDVIVRMVVPLDWSAALVSWLFEYTAELEQHAPTVERLVTLPWADVFALEAVAAGTSMAPRVSMNSYWRLCTRNIPGIDLDAIMEMLLGRPEVAHVWAELQVLVAADPWTGANVASQPFLGAAPLGVAAFGHVNTHRAGSGAHLIALELGWNVQHVDLARHHIGKPIWGDNIATAKKGPRGERFANHGTSSLGVAVGASPPGGRRRVGVAPGVSSVRVVSCFDRHTNVAEHVANAIVHAVAASTNMGRHVAYDTVLLLEVQRAFLPTEVDEADFHAIRLATALGLTVVEPAGNGGIDLDGVALPGISGSGDPDGSGAIVVGAVGMAGATFGPLRDSNYGGRVDCSAHALGLRTCGRAEDRHGVLEPALDVNSAERSDFARTSAAAAVVAGAVLAIIAYGKATGKTPTPLGVREWLKREPLKGPPNLGVMVDLAALGTRTIPSLPLSLAAGNVQPHGVYAVSTPQTSEGETSLWDRVANPVERGIIVTPVVVVYPAPPGFQPATNASYTEHTMYYDPTPFLHGQKVGLRYVSPPPSVGGYGVWNGARRAQEAAAHPSRRYAQMQFSYAPMPTKNEEVDATHNPEAGLPTMDFYLIFKGGALVGELRRCPDGARFVDHWVLFDNYTYPAVGQEVQLDRQGTPPTDTRTWLEAKILQGNGTATPKPKWYVKYGFEPEPI